MPIIERTRANLRYLQKKYSKKKKNRCLFFCLLRKFYSLEFGRYSKERIYLIMNLGLLISSGMTIINAVESIEKEIKSPLLKKLLKQVRLNLDEGMPLWKALEETNLFNPYAISLVRIGEESGRLSENLKLIAEQSSKDREFKSKIKGALMYPIFVLSLTFILGVLVAWFVLPKLAIVFKQMQVELPFLTKMLIKLGVFLKEYGAIVLPILGLVFFIVIYFLFINNKTKFIGQSILFLMPGLTDFIKDVEIARFTYLLATLLDAGLPITIALDSLHKSTTFPKYKRFYKYLFESIEDGNSFQKTFANYKRINKLLPISVQQLIIAGEQSGNLVEVLTKINQAFERKTEHLTKNFTAILEPILLIIVWIGVVTVALAIIMPIYSLVGNMNTSG